MHETGLEGHYTLLPPTNSKEKEHNT